MRLATYLYFRNFLSKDECNRIIEEGEKDLKIATINPKEQERLNSKNELRNTKVGFIRNGSPVQDLMEKIINHMMLVCVEAYGVYLTDVEPIQYAKYTKGMFYDWHVDSASTIDDLKVFRRDISASLILNEKKEYTGSSLQMVLNNSIDKKTNNFDPQDVENQDQGTLIIFPSSFIHRVTEVETGTRKSLVLWSCSNIKPAKPT